MRLRERIARTVAHNLAMVMVPVVVFKLARCVTVWAIYRGLIPVTLVIN